MPEQSEQPEGEQTPSAVLHAFREAWRDRDVAALLLLVTDDVVYSSSVGPEPGTSYRGRAAAQAGFEAMLAHDQVIDIVSAPLLLLDNHAVAEWHYRCADGTWEHGIDVFELRGGRIASKNAFRKCRT
jgi:ketosteroid isomerase-like protein